MKYLSAASLLLASANAVPFTLTSVDHNGQHLLSDTVHSFKRLLGEEVEYETPLQLKLEFSHEGEEFSADLFREAGAITSGTELFVNKVDGTLETSFAPQTYQYKNKDAKSNFEWVLTFHSHEKFDGLHIDTVTNRVLYFVGQNGDLEVNAEAHKFYDGALFPHIQEDVHGRSLAIEYWSNCYPGQESFTREFMIGFAVGSRLGNKLGQTATIAHVNSVVSLSNAIYYPQMNLKLAVGAIFIEQGGANAAVFDNPQCANEISTQLNQLQNWPRPSTQGTWHLLDDCFGHSGNTLGIAKLGVLCRSRVNVGVSYYTEGSGTFTEQYPTWATVAHEVGHNFNAQHSFENGQGRTGGIMDYGPLRNRLIDGSMQFNTPLRKREVCAEISRVINCPFLRAEATPAPTPLPTTLATSNPTPFPVAAPVGGINECQRFPLKVFLGEADILVGSYNDQWTPASCYQKCQETAGCKSFVTSANRRYCELWSDKMTESNLQDYADGGFDTYICPFVSDGNPATNDKPRTLSCTIHRNAVIPGQANVYQGSSDPFWTLETCGKGCAQTPNCFTFTFSEVNKYCEMWSQQNQNALVSYSNYDTYLCTESQQAEIVPAEEETLDDLLGNANIKALSQQCCSKTDDKYYLGMNKLYVDGARNDFCEKICIEDTNCYSYTYNDAEQSCEFWTQKEANETSTNVGVVTTDCDRLCIANAVRPDIKDTDNSVLIYAVSGAAAGFVALIALVSYIALRRKVEKTAKETKPKSNAQSKAASVRQAVMAAPAGSVEVDSGDDYSPQDNYAARGAAHYSGAATGAFGYSGPPPNMRR